MSSKGTPVFSRFQVPQHVGGKNTLVILTSILTSKIPKLVADLPKETSNPQTVREIFIAVFCKMDENKFK